ncbi:MAG: RNA-binding S4 domain-containing protein [Oscillospiraceae bacterium]|nr:RNA-binding S4 domain-containing protein [Oscillospiraceae bacterium]
MKVKLRGVSKVRIRGEYIKLDSLLKHAGFVSTGGEAKILIRGEEVYVGGQVCTQRGKKITPGDVVRCGDSVLIVSSRG